MALLGEPTRAQAHGFSVTAVCEREVRAVTLVLPPGGGVRYGSRGPRGSISHGRHRHTSGRPARWRRPRNRGERDLPQIGETIPWTEEVFRWSSSCGCGRPSARSVVALSDRRPDRVRRARGAGALPPGGGVEHRLDGAGLGVRRGVLFWWQGRAPAEEYLAGFLIEKSLSLDNLFVFAWSSRSSRRPASTSAGCSSGGSWGRSSCAGSSSSWVRAPQRVPLHHLPLRRLPDRHRDPDGAEARRRRSTPSATRSCG